MTYDRATTTVLKPLNKQIIANNPKPAGVETEAPGSLPSLALKLGADVAESLIQSSSAASRRADQASRRLAGKGLLRDDCLQRLEALTRLLYLLADSIHGRPYQRLEATTVQVLARTGVRTTRASGHIASTRA